MILGTYITLISLCVCVFLPSLQVNGGLSASLKSAIWNGSVNTFPQQRIQATIKELLDVSFFVAVGVAANENLQVCVSKTFPRQRRIAGGVVFHTVSFVWKKSTRLVLHRTCFNLQTTKCLKVLYYEIVHDNLRHEFEIISNISLKWPISGVSNSVCN
jgi:hypothetical protein